MELPDDITSIISEYAWAWRAPTRPNWREGSSIIVLLNSDPIWQEWKEKQKWKQNNELQERANDVKPGINDVLIGLSVAICADIFVRVTIPFFRKLKKKL